MYNALKSQWEEEKLLGKKNIKLKEAQKYQGPKLFPQKKKKKRVKLKVLNWN